MNSHAVWVCIPTLLFVCVENTFRSMISEALFNARAPPGWRAESAGVRPAAAINPVVPALLRERGIELAGKIPQLVTPQMVARAWYIVTFGCLDRCPPGTKGKCEDWTFPGAAGRSLDELRGIRDAIGERVGRLMTSLPGLPADGRGS